MRWDRRIPHRLLGNLADGRSLGDLGGLDLGGDGLLGSRGLGHLAREQGRKKVRTRTACRFHLRSFLPCWKSMLQWGVGMSAHASPAHSGARKQSPVRKHHPCRPSANRDVAKWGRGPLSSAFLTCHRHSRFLPCWRRRASAQRFHVHPPAPAAVPIIRSMRSASLAHLGGLGNSGSLGHWVNFFVFGEAPLLLVFLNTELFF
jgi:hypothetical protein